MLRQRSREAFPLQCGAGGQFPDWLRPNLARSRGGAPSEKFEGGSAGKAKSATTGISLGARRGLISAEGRAEVTWPAAFGFVATLLTWAFFVAAANDPRYFNFSARTSLWLDRLMFSFVCLAGLILAGKTVASLLGL